MDLTSEVIKGKLFSFQTSAHSLHLDTRSFAEHKALQKLYEGIDGIKDDILEILMGYQNGKRIGKAKLDEFPTYSQEAVTGLVKEGMSFAYELEMWAENKKYWFICKNTIYAYAELKNKYIYVRRNKH